MNLLLRMIGAVTERLGYRLFPFNRQQLLPEGLPDRELYWGPEDTSRLFRPWRGRECELFLTPEVVQNTMLSRQKLYFLRKMLRQTLSVEGDIFEAGAGSGGSARLLLDGLLESRSNKQLWVLDTFEGYQKVDARRDGSHVQINQCRCRSQKEVALLLANPTISVNIIPGLIPDTLAQIKARAISLAHIDVNLYEPTHAATVFCLDRMPRGGVIVFDDYSWPSTYGARQAIDEACAQHGQEVICLPESTQAFLVKT